MFPAGPPEVRGSETMIRKVASEAEAGGAIIHPKLIVSARPAVNAGRWLAAAAECRCPDLDDCCLFD